MALAARRKTTANCDSQTMPHVSDWTSSTADVAPVPMTAPNQAGCRRTSLISLPSYTPWGILSSMSSTLLALRAWSARRWATAVAAGIVTGLLVALPTAVIPNPVFGRTIGVTWWAYPVVVVTAILGGLLVATYVRSPQPVFVDTATDDVEPDRPMKLGAAGALVSFFAVGCPVCNKLVLLALGATGAVTWFAPVQPFLAAASIVLMAWALRTRLRGEVACSVPGDAVIRS